MLLPKYTFENFVIYNGNKAAYDAAQHVINRSTPSPLIISGSAGTGKTHLLAAIGDEILKNDPTKRIVFLDLCCVAYATKSHEHGKNTKYSLPDIIEADVLLIDAVQLFDDRTIGFQKLLAEMLPEILKSKKQIVLTASCTPLELSGLATELEQFWNICNIINISSPKKEERLEVLAKMAELNSIPITTDELAVLAATENSCMRELSGLLVEFNAARNLRSATTREASCVGFYE